MFENKKDAIYLITDARGLDEETFYARIEEACRAGIDILQLREKEATTRELLEKGARMQQIAKEYGVPFVIDDRVDVALALDTDGVHVGADDLPVAMARKLLGPDKIVGATAKTLEAARAAQKDGADYLGVGAIFATTTHDNPVRTSVDTLKDIVQAVDIGVLAIGGLTADNVDVLRGTEANGACVVRYLMQSEQITKDVTRLRQALQTNEPNEHETDEKGLTRKSDLQ